jgi:hypothetical protein
MGVANEELVDLAVDVFNEELDHWQRWPDRFGTTMLRRSPLLRDVMPTDESPEVAAIERHMVPDRLVLDFLKQRRRGCRGAGWYRIAALGRWYEPDKLMGYCVAAYLAKS